MLKAVTSAGGGGASRTSRIVGGASPVALVANDDIIAVNNTTGAPIELDLPAAPTANENHTIKDIGAAGVGNFATNNAIVSGNGHTIEGAATKVMDMNGEGLTFIFLNGQWSIL